MSEVSNSEVLNYKSISNDLRLLFEGIETFKNKRVSFAEDFKSLSVYLANLKLNHAFPTLEKEINEIISKWDITNSLANLNNKLIGDLNKIEFIDKEIEKIRAYLPSMAKYPDKCNRKNVSDKINVFLQNINNISLSQLDIICSQVIPNVHKMAESVFNGFTEKSKENKKKAFKLKESTKKHLDCFTNQRLVKICTDGNQIADRILQSPNLFDPDADAQILERICNKFESCREDITNEDIAYKELKKEIEDNESNIWVEDYYKLIQVLDKGAWNNDTPSVQLYDQYHRYINEKNQEIDKIVSGLNKEVLDYLNNDLKKVRNSAYKKSDFYDLVYNAMNVIAERKKQWRLKMLKIAGIVVAIILAIVLIAWTWPYSGYVLGFIVAVIVYGVIKGWYD